MNTILTTKKKKNGPEGTFRPTLVSVKVNLYCGVSTRVEDLSGVDLNDGHGAGP